MQFDAIKPTTTSPAFIDVTAETFQKEVVDRSKTAPVLLDFWATWCGPCKTLSPTLEKVTREMGGRLVLAKVDIDQNPELADAFGVQSVPTVVLLVGGKIVDGFVGAQSEAKIREVVAKHIGAAKRDGIEDALALEKSGDAQGAISVLRSALRDAPTRQEVRAHLARLLLVTGLTAEGSQVYEALTPEGQELEPARAAKGLIELAKSRVDVAPLQAAVDAKPDDIAARLALGRALLADNQPEKALDVLLAAAKRDLKFDSGAPRKALIDAFEVLGDTHPLVTRFRRELSLLLCS